MNKIFVLFCFGILSCDAIGRAQSLTNKPLFEADSIKVVANEKFPNDLESEIFVGPKGSPYFYTEGKQSQLHAATIEMSADASTSISVVQKEGETNSYALYLFSYDAEGKTLGLFDLNMDGTWDVKRTPTRTQKNFILFQSQWFAVDRIDGLLSKTPTAKSGSTNFMFQGIWKSSN
jgi:hypothetical protein